MSCPVNLQDLPSGVFEAVFTPETVRGRTSKNSLTALSFPKSRSALWDGSTAGEKLRLQLCARRNPRLLLMEKALRLAQRHARQSNKPRLLSFLVGSVSVDADEEGVTVTLDRFDPGRDQAGSCRVPSALLPGDVVVPCRFSTQTEPTDAVVQSEAELHLCFQALQQCVSSRQALDLSQLMKVRGHVVVSQQSDAASFVLRWSAVCPSVGVDVQPIRSVPVIPTALLRSLTGLHRGAPPASRQRGFLTMDQTRKLLLLLESDPKAYKLPLVGLWLSGVAHVSNPQVWAWCVRFLYSAALQDRVLSESRCFLLVLFASTHRAPQFFQCRGPGPGPGPGPEPGQAPQLDYQLLSASQCVTLYQQVVPVEGRTLQCDLGQGDQSSQTEVFREARTSFSRTLSVSDQDSGVEDGDSSPRPSPSPHPPAQQARRVQPSVPELSLLIDSSFTSNQNARQDPGCAHRDPPLPALPPPTTSSSSSAPRPAAPPLHSTPNSNLQELCCCCSTHTYDCTSIFSSPGLHPLPSHHHTPPPPSHHHTPPAPSHYHTPPPPSHHHTPPTPSSLHPAPPPSSHHHTSPPSNHHTPPPSNLYPAPPPPSSHHHTPPPPSSLHPAPPPPPSSHHHTPPPPSSLHPGPPSPSSHHHTSPPPPSSLHPAPPSSSHHHTPPPPSSLHPAPPPPSSHHHTPPPPSHHPTPPPSSLHPAPPPSSHHHTPPPPSHHPTPPSSLHPATPPSSLHPAPPPPPPSSHHPTPPPPSSLHPAPPPPSSSLATTLSSRHHTPSPCSTHPPHSSSLLLHPPPAPWCGDSPSPPPSHPASPPPWFSRPSCVNRCCDQVGGVVPPDTYKLLLHQDRQLRLLQAQVQMLLEAQGRIQSSAGQVEAVTPRSTASIAVGTGASLFWGNPVQSPLPHQGAQAPPLSSPTPLSSHADLSAIGSVGGADGSEAVCSSSAQHRCSVSGLESPVLGESASMCRAEGEQQNFYHNLMTQLTSRLQEPDSKQEVEEESSRRSPSVSSQSSQSRRKRSGGGDPVLRATVRQLQQLGVDVDREDLTESERRIHQTVEISSTLASINPAAVLSRLSVTDPTASVLFPEGSVDLSLEANAIALRYLSDSQLSRLCVGGHAPSHPGPASNHSLLSPSNMSLATRKYMRRYGLIEEEEEEEEEEQAPARQPLTEALNVKLLPQSQLIWDLRPKMQLLAGGAAADKENCSSRRPSLMRASGRQPEGSMGNILDLSRLRQLPKLF